MLSQIKKGILSSLGMVIVTREKVEQITRHLVEDAKLSEEEGRRLVEELIEAGEKQQSYIEDAVRQALRRGIEKLDICRGEDFRRIEERVENLEKRAQIQEETIQRLEKA